MKETVFMIRQLNREDGYAAGRAVFLLSSDKKFGKLAAKILFDKTVRGTYTTGREILYV